MPLRVTSFQPRNSELVALGQFTVLVGPNNCGKSRTLLDIRDYVTSGSLSRLKILTQIEVDIPSQAETKAELRELPHQNPGHVRFLGVASDLQKRHEFSPQTFWLDQQYQNLTNPDIRAQLLQHVGTFWVAHLDAEGRFRIAAPCESYDTRTEAPANAMQAFFAGGKAALDDLRSAFRDAFATDIALDWAAMKSLYLRVGPSFGSIPDGRSELDSLLKEAPSLADQGDGFKSFAGVALAMLTFPTGLLLLDEPDAFLHPAQARVLGRWLANEAKKRPAQVIVASHSSDFLWGIVSANAEASVIRLNRSDSTTTYSVVPAATTSGLVQSPLLSSQPVLDSLFHRGVVVCEGDPDRAIYQTVAHTLLRKQEGEDILFIHSNGKDAAKTPLELLRQANTPVCAVVDFDVLNSERVLTEIVTALTGAAPTRRAIELRNIIAAYVEQASEEQLSMALQSAVASWLGIEHSSVRQARRALALISRHASKWDVVKRSGIDFFDGQGRIEVLELLASLRSQGLFIVPVGELESWMGISVAKGARWNRAALEQLHAGRCPEPLKAFVEGLVTHIIPAKIE